jgi:uncharacterized protein (DUF2342 family)
VNLYRSVRAVTGASGNGAIDWDAVAEAARASTDPGSLDVSDAEREAYASDVRDARTRIRSVGDLAFDVPNRIEVQNRHHWIDANVDTFSRVMQPVEKHTNVAIPGVSRVVNTGTMSFMLAFLGRNVLGQYDPLLLADSNDHALYFVRPNIIDVADKLDVDYDRFRRWIAFHEVTHAAEFGAAPWLSDHLEANMDKGIEALSEGSLDREAFEELDATMTVVEGYAELLMDHAFDGEYEDLRKKLDARRQGRGPLAGFVRRALGLGMKRRQYERGKAFFEHVAERRSVDAANVVWEGPENLPSSDEIDDPDAWLQRVK